MMNFTNYARTRKYVGKIVEPKNEDEIINTIKNLKNDEKIKVIGSLHSWTDQFRGFDIYITLKENMNKILNFNKTEKTITVQCGAILNEVQKFLSNKGYVLRNTPQSKDATIGGIISNGVHGQGGQIFSENIIELKMIDGLGNKLIINKNVNSDLLPALKCNLGVCGVIYEATLKIEKLKNVTLTFDHLTVNSSVKDYLKNKLNDKSDRSLMLFSPYTNTLMVVGFRDSNDEQVNFISKLFSYILSFYFKISKTYYNLFIKPFMTMFFWLLNFVIPLNTQYLFFIYELSFFKYPLISLHYLFSFIFYLLSYLTKFININLNDEFIYPSINYLAEPYPLDRDNTYNFIYDIPFVYYESEWALDINNIYNFFQDTTNLVKSIDYVFPIPYSVRVVKKSDDVWISPTYNQDSVYTSFFWFPSFYNTTSEAFYSLLNKWYNLMYRYKARPHWAKYFNESNSEYIKSIYPKYPLFVDVVNKLDPNKIFSSNQMSLFDD